MRARRLALLMGAWPVIASAQSSVNRLQFDDSVRSARMGDMRSLRIVLPDAYYAARSSNDRYPVLLALDADGTDFETIVTLAHRLAIPTGMAVPNMIIVGLRSGSTRGRDMYTAPTTADDSLNTGGDRAPDLLAFIDEELKPWLDQRFRTAPFYVIRGHSAAGFFVTYAVAHRPNAFHGAIASSPAVWWNNATAVSTYAPLVAKSHTRFFLADGAFDARELDEPVQRFASSMQASGAQPDRFEYRRYPDDNHQTSGVQAIIDGLRFIFRPIALANAPLNRLGGFHSSAAAWREAFAKTRDAYARGAKELGLSPALPSGWVQYAASLARLRGHRDVAREICQQYATDRPDIALSEVCAAEAR